MKTKFHLRPILFLISTPSKVLKPVLFLTCIFLFFGCQQSNNEEISSPTEEVNSGRHSPGQKEIPAKDHGRDINMITLIVTNNYIQHPNDSMELFNYHLYGEIFVLPRENVKEGSMTPKGGSSNQISTSLDYRSYFFEGGYFKSMGSVYEQYPQKEFLFDMTYADGTMHEHTLPLPDAPEPPPTRMSIYQNGQQVSHLEIDPSIDFSVRWTPFSDGVEDPKGIMNDLVTIMLDPCGEGKRVYMSGVPTMNPQHLTFKDKEAIIPAGTLNEGTWYWLNGEFSNVAYTSKVDGAPAISSYMNATYLAIRTKGGAEQSPCEVFLSKME